MIHPSNMVCHIGIEASRLVALIEDAQGVPSAVECEVGSDGTLRVIGQPIDIEAVVEATKRAVVGKSPPGSVTAEIRSLRIALLGTVSLLQAMAASRGGE